MKNLKRVSRWMTVAFIAVVTNFLVTTSGFAAGLLTPSNAQFSVLEIKTHDVNVIIEDGFAITTVEQVFSNPHSQDLEAVYSFPVPEKAAVAEFTVWIDGKPVIGEVLEKQQAREVYRAEKQAGRDAGLMQKDEYKTFDMKVSPVRAGQDTRIRFVYMQPADVDTGMGRYVYPLEEGGVDEQKFSFWTATETVQQQFSFNLALKSSYPVEALRFPNQSQAVISQKSAGEWSANLTSSGSNPQVEQGQQVNAMQPAFKLDKDLVVYWRHQAGLPGSVDLVSYKPEGARKGTFMLTLTPGDDLKLVEEGRDWIFVLDISGSMNGKYATLVDGVQRALSKMNSNDRFRVVLFNNRAQELTQGYVNATPEMVKHYSDSLLQVTPGNGTNLYAGLKNGLRGIDADRTSSIVLVTDGVANVGETHQKKFIKLLAKKDIRLFTFIMGNSANRPMLQTLTRVSNGFAISISNSDDIVGKIMEATSKVTHQSLHGVELSIRGVKTSNVSPKKISSLYRGQQLVIFGHYWGEGLADIHLSGKISGEKKDYSTQIEFPATANAHPELERLWAYSSIQDMMQEMNDFGEDADLKQAVTDLSIEYGLVSNYTSMVVVRDEVFESLGIKRFNKQRVENEKQTQSKRSTQTPVSRRVDTQQPMFNSTRASHSGSGSFDSWMFVLLLPMLVISRRFRKY
ncbi:MAG: VWA domain-containing protein [Gammaproteobacteria bacterium]|jgi:Ca-activated chloride channel family protein|nr:VWA domain-containing protein [Gammaproteobacteria bacterium]MBT6553729.1 VWA domain-containing protein [Gammaproteobacteria bacterium]